MSLSQALNQFAQNLGRYRTCIDSEAVRIIGQWPISMSYEITENPNGLQHSD